MSAEPAEMGDYRFIVSRTDKSRYIIDALNGRPAKQVYEKIPMS